MATKPATPVTVRASQEFYTTGPAALIGTVTKIDPGGPQTTEGWKVDSPLGTFPVPAQWRNYSDNLTDQYLSWVEGGSSSSGNDTHIVETDADGRINVAGCTIDNVVNDIALSVTGADGQDAIQSFPSGESRGLLVVGSVAEAIKVTCDVATGIEVDSSGIGTAGDFSSSGGLAVNATSTGPGAAVQVTGQDGPGLIIKEQTGTGAPLEIEKSFNTPTTFDGDAGALWTIDTGSSEADYIGVRLNGGNDYVQSAINKSVYGYNIQGSGIISGASVLTVVTGTGAGGHCDVINTPVLIEISLNITATVGTGNNIGLLTLTDTTAAPAVITTYAVNIQNAGAVGGQYPYMWRRPYQLTAFGDSNEITAELSTANGYTLDVTDFILNFKSNNF